MDESALRALITSHEACRSSYHSWLELFTVLVAIGVLFEFIFVIWEYVGELHDFERGIVHPPEKPNMLLFALGLLGAALVAIGVAGEFRFESKIETEETIIRKANDDLFLRLSKEAGDAAASAKAARAEADAVGKKTDVLDIRLENASRNLGTLEQDIRAQGPRWRLLKKVTPELVIKLTPFAWQRVRLFVCGRLGLQDGETLSTWATIAEIINTDGAKWKVERGGLEYFDRGCSPSGGQPLGQGIIVFVSKHGSKSAMDAAMVLSDGIIKALPASPYNALSLIDPDFSQRFSQPIEGNDTPWAIAGDSGEGNRDSELIVISIPE
jgi:hypothetical protein